MKALDYENFIRDAFGRSSGTLVERWGDPASMANTDAFDDDNLDNVKFGVGYAMGIFKNLMDSKRSQLSDAENAYINEFSGRLIQCENIDCVHHLIKEFDDNVVDKYLK